MKSMRQAFALLTILPFGPADLPEPGDSGRAASWYPLVGIVIGAATAAGWWVLGRFLPPMAAAPLTLALWVLLTGGLHLDGLADCCDGLLCSATPARRLEIMSDSRLGSFAGIGLCLALLVKFAAIISLAPNTVPFVFMLAGGVSRWLVTLAGKQPLAKPGGMAADFASGLTSRTILLAGILPLILVIIGGWRAFAAAGLSIAAAWLIFRFARNRIGGVSGDVFGLTIELTELVVLLTYAAR
jgi:adenosylcobinamide-GDP ribazoletransferase